MVHAHVEVVVVVSCITHTHNKTNGKNTPRQSNPASVQPTSVSYTECKLPALAGCNLQPQLAGCCWLLVLAAGRFLSLCVCIAQSRKIVDLSLSFSVLCLPSSPRDTTGCEAYETATYETAIDTVEHLQNMERNEMEKHLGGTALESCGLVTY